MSDDKFVDGNELELSKLLLDDELVDDVIAREAVVSGVSRYDKISIGSTMFSGKRLSPSCPCPSPSMTAAGSKLRSPRSVLIELLLLPLWLLELLALLPGLLLTGSPFELGVTFALLTDGGPMLLGVCGV